MIDLAIKLFLVAFFINLTYELLHSVLYKTCLEMPVKKYVPLMLKASIVDAIWITGFYFITYFVFGEKNPLNNVYQVTFFALISISWAYFWEIYSIKNKRWEYAKSMPLVAGAGLTPLIQLFLTGLLSFYLVFNLFG